MLKGFDFINSKHRDLSNGFILAEILSRYANSLKIRIEMRSFSTGTSLEEKQTNWDLIKRILRKIEKFPLTDQIINDVIIQAPNAAYDFICDIYRFLTKKE
jgi:hypothetical protein